MTIQEAAQTILEEIGTPTTSREISRIALERHLVISNAKDPVQSHAQTIEKNIRDGVYNKPKLVFIHSKQGRLIGLPFWEVNLSQETEKKTYDYEELKIKVPVDLYEKIHLASKSRLAKTLDETVVLLLRKGLTSVSAEIKKGLLEQISELDQL